MTHSNQTGPTATGPASSDSITPESLLSASAQYGSIQAGSVSHGSGTHVSDPSGSLTGAGEAQTVLALRDVGKSFQDSGETVQVLKHAALEVYQGERVALLGPSGSGKTTLLNIAAGLESPDTGQVLVHGCDLTRLSERQRSLLRRRRLGFVFQGFNLFPQLTASANIRVTLRLNRLRGPRWDAAVTDIMQHMGIAHLATRLPQQMSGGEQQRVAIARALVHEPDLVLADEPTGNLDQAHAAEVLDLLMRVSASSGLLLVTHSQSAAARCDRILRMHDGCPRVVDPC